MAKRKQNLAGKLSSQTETRPGWRDAITGGLQSEQPDVRRPGFMEAEPEVEPADKVKRKTYLLYAGMIGEIETLAAQEHVGINELVRYLLGVVLDQVYEGKVSIPTQPGRRQISQ